MITIRNLITFIASPCSRGPIPMRSLTSRRQQRSLLAITVAALTLAHAAAVPLPANCVSWWRAENTFADAVGTNHGTAKNGVAFAAGNVGQCFSLDGTDDYVQIPSSVDLNLVSGQGWTMEGWIKPDVLADKFIAHKGASANGTTIPYWGFFIRPTGQLGFEVCPGIGYEVYDYAQSATPVESGIWQHVAVVVDNMGGATSGYHFYVNGISAGIAESVDRTSSGTVNTAEPLTIGSYRGQLLFFDGSIDELAVYSRALAASEIAAIHAAGSTGKISTAPAPTITSPSPLIAGTVGIAYSQSLSATGGTTPYAWIISSGSLPSGLSLSTAGSITGTPSETGTATFTVRVTGNDSAFSTKDFSLTINPASVSPYFTSIAPPSSGMVGTAYNHSCTASGTTPITFSVSTGALPSGLVLSLEGEITGTPDTAGSFSGTITAANGTLPNATQEFSIVISEFHSLVTAATHGTVTGGGNYLHGTTATLTATGNPGYVFSTWTGDVTGTANPLAVLMDSDKIITANFVPDPNDTDHDGLTNYQEVVEYHTNPEASDTDGDGFADGYEVSSGFNPTSADSAPDTQMNIYTSVELEFGAGLGKTYRVESSTDLQTWTTVESGIVGTGGMITRLYSNRAIPHRYFRAVRE